MDKIKDFSISDLDDVNTILKIYREKLNEIVDYINKSEQEKNNANVR